MGRPSVRPEPPKSSEMGWSLCQKPAALPRIVGRRAIHLFMVNSWGRRDDNFRELFFFISLFFLSCSGKAESVAAAGNAPLKKKTRRIWPPPPLPPPPLPPPPILPRSPPWLFEWIKDTARNRKPIWNALYALEWTIIVIPAARGPKGRADYGHSGGYLPLFYGGAVAGRSSEITIIARWYTFPLNPV